MSRSLTASMEDALVLLYRHRTVARAGRPVRGTLSRHPLYLLPATADALERRGLAVVSSGYVGLSDEGRTVAERLHQERADAERERERERLEARAAGMPPAPTLRVVR